ncbi:MAG: 16S rRNA (cytidine(1402)-2'-O)-methyltransferase [Pseudomonadota bacterium]
METPANRGRLYVVSTPIGNLEDISLRALRILKEVDLIAAEDTRLTRKLLSHYKIHTRLESCHEYTHRERLKGLIEKIEHGLSIALVTDAGTPGISDPGYGLIRLAVENDLLLTPIPGPSAAITALCISGLSTDSFSFYGFLPRHSKKRRFLLNKMSSETNTLVIYESPKRVKDTLQESLLVLGDRNMLLAREMTKTFEEFIRGKISEVLDELEGKQIKGEITLVFEGAEQGSADSGNNLIETVRTYLENTDLKLGAISKTIAEEFNISRSEVYRLALRIQKEGKRRG